MPSPDEIIGRIGAVLVVGKSEEAELRATADPHRRIDGNSFSGTIPTELGDMSLLTDLCVARAINPCVGAPPVCGQEGAECEAVPWRAQVGGVQQSHRDAALGAGAHLFVGYTVSTLAAHRPPAPALVV